jgi:hypothetical protein
MKDQWIEWLQDRQRHFFYGVLMVIMTFFVAFQVFSKFHKPRASQYFAANQAFEKWLIQGEAIDKLEKAIAAHPELEAKFGALIADRYIVQNEGDKAEPYADSVFKRVLKQSPEHTAFAEGSLQIAKGHLREALVHTVALKERMDKESILYGFNLVRLASLYRALSVHDQELAALEELEQYMQENQKRGSILAECFNEGGYTLSDYIEGRKQSALR